MGLPIQVKDRSTMSSDTGSSGDVRKADFGFPSYSIDQRAGPWPYLLGLRGLVLAGRSSRSLISTSSCLVNPFDPIDNHQGQQLR